MTGAPDITDRAIHECHEADVRNIWIYKSVHECENHKVEMEIAQARGTAIVEGYCPFMFLPHPALIHRVHRFIMKVTGSYPL